MNAEAENEAPPAPEPNKPTPAPSAKGSLLIEWVWGAAAMKALRATGPASTPSGMHQHRQANLALELARSALEPLQPLEYGPAHAVACNLYRQAIYWTLLARAGSHSDAAGGFDAVWAAADQATLREAAGNADKLVEIEKAVKGKTFIEYGALEPAVSAELSRSLRHFAETLVDKLDAPQEEVERIWMRRLARVSVVLVAAVVALVAVVTLLEAREKSRDVAAGKPWSISSRYPAGCTSPEQHCADSPGFFFHTNEEQDPWIVLDLQQSTQISGVRVTNRSDCCSERAIPLVVEVSEDQNHWNEVVRRTTDFGTWKGSFAPVKARYVKLHTPRHTLLHLQEVRVLR
ncbi:MAG: discoidin domain-containing protein [Polyangiaceae bacterium]